MNSMTEIAIRLPLDFLTLEAAGNVRRVKAMVDMPNRC